MKLILYLVSWRQEDLCRDKPRPPCCPLQKSQLVQDKISIYLRLHFCPDMSVWFCWSLWALQVNTSILPSFALLLWFCWASPWACCVLDAVWLVLLISLPVCYSSQGVCVCVSAVVHLILRVLFLRFVYNLPVEFGFIICISGGEVTSLSLHFSSFLFLFCLLSLLSSSFSFPFLSQFSIMMTRRRKERGEEAEERRRQ